MHALLRLTAVVSSVGVLSACSGDGGTLPATDAGLQTRPVAETARGAALTSIGAKCDEIAANGQAPAAQNEAIAAYVRTLPDIAFASTSPDGVVAVFYDGQPLILLNNITPGPGASTTRAARPPAARGSVFAVPDGKPGTALLLNGFSPEFPADPSATIAAMLTAKGYAAVTGGGSVEDFKKVAGQSVLHIRTHGGGGDVLDANGKVVEVKDADGKLAPYRLFALWTTDTVNDLNLATYGQDLAARRLVRMREVVSPGVVWSDKEYHLGVTAPFIDQYWGALANDAYVHVSACSAGGNAELVGTLRNQGSGVVVVGWTKPAVVTHMDRAAKYLFDRLLGVNQLDTAEDPKESPPQRPFDFSSLATLMESRGSSSSDTKFGLSQLVASTAGDTYGYVLAPSIATVRANDPADVLELEGFFSDSRGDATVTVGGAPCPIVYWGSGTVSCTLDRTSQGDVVVKVRGHESNKVKLTSWRSKIYYRVESDEVGTTASGLSQAWTLDVHLRGDVGSYRDEPGKPPVAHQKVITMARDSKGTVVAGGTAAVPDCTVQWNGQSSIALDIWGAPVLGAPGYPLNLTGVVDEGDPGSLWFEVYSWAQPCYSLTATGTGSNGCSNHATDIHCAFPIDRGLLATNAAHVFYDLLSGRLSTPATLTATGTIQANSLASSDSVCCGGEGNVPWGYRQRAWWDVMTPAGGSAPNPSADER